MGFANMSDPNFSLSEDEDHIMPLDVADVSVCKGVPRRLWCTKAVTLLNDKGQPVAKGICHSISSNLVLGIEGLLGCTHVAIQISKFLSTIDILDEWRYFVHTRPIEYVIYNGANFRDHEVRYNFNNQQANVLQPSSSSSRPYINTVRNPSRETCFKAKDLVLSKVYFSKNCLQPFPRDKIRAFRECIYRETSFQLRYHMKLEIHWQIHCGMQGRKVVTIEGIDVCIPAWREILGVSEATFHNFQKLAFVGVQVQHHGNLGLRKRGKHTSQATATLKCIFDKSADHMTHCTCTLSNGEKVASMILPATFKWKETIPEINTVNAEFGLKEVSPSNLSKIRKLNFPQYNVKKSGDNFTGCSKCDRLYYLRRVAIAGLQQSMKWTKNVNAKS